jgi:hypothetical protein
MQIRKKATLLPYKLRVIFRFPVQNLFAQVEQHLQLPLFLRVQRSLLGRQQVRTTTYPLTQ